MSTWECQSYVNMWTETVLNIFKMTGKNSPLRVQQDPALRALEASFPAGQLQKDLDVLTSFNLGNQSLLRLKIKVLVLELIPSIDVVDQLIENNL